MDPRPELPDGLLHLGWRRAAPGQHDSGAGHAAL